MSVHCIIPFPLLIFSLIKFVQSCMIDGQKLTCLADFNLFLTLSHFIQYRQYFHYDMIASFCRVVVKFWIKLMETGKKTHLQHLHLVFKM